MNLDLNILIETRTKRVANVQLGIVLDGCQPGFCILRAAPAYYLYIALTGHDCTEQPNLATPVYANLARAHIQANAWRNPAWQLAQEVVNQWGLYIRPWLSCFYLKNGKLIEDAPEYRVLIDLRTGQRLKPASHYWHSTRGTMRG